MGVCSRGQKDYIRVSPTIPRKAKKEERRLMYSSGLFIEAPGGTKSLIKAEALKRLYPMTLNNTAIFSTGHVRTAKYSKYYMFQE